MNELVLIVLSGLCGLLLGALLVYWRSQQRQQQLQQELHQLRGQLTIEQRLAAQQQEQLAAQFSQLSQQALHKNNESFLQLAKENLGQHQLQAQNELAKREQAIQAGLKPIQDALQKTEEQIRAMEKERQTAYGSLTRHLQAMAESQQQLQSETRNLVKALRRPEVRGQWGELTLRRLVELAGMVEHCDFSEQASINSDEQQRLRPDMLVRMPENRTIVVDAKTPLDAYLSAMEAEDDNQRRNHLEQHARNLQKRIRELSSKHYWSQFERSPEFAVLFIPGEQFLAAALDLHPELQEQALNERVILATPNNFVALLKTIAFGWRQLSIAENAEEIRQLGAELHHRLATFFEHVSGIGKALGQGVERYNKAVGSLQHNVMPSARKFTELGISAKKQPELPEQITLSLREIGTAATDSND